MKLTEIFEEENHKEYFAISSWDDPYGRSDDEYFIIGPAETSAIARKAANRKLEAGQPRSFTNWSKGKIKIVERDKIESVLAKMKLNVPTSLADGDYEFGSMTLWRPSAIR